MKQVIPFGAFDSTDPEDLWAFMAGYEEKTGGRILAIPHNPNASNGVMFAETVNGEAMTRDYAERRARWEPLLEVTQMKGDSEAHPLLCPEDEFADFENWDQGNIAGIPKEDWMLQYEHARSALQVGIRLQEKLGANPFKFGMIGSSDTHTSLSTLTRSPPARCAAGGGLSGPARGSPRATPGAPSKCRPKDGFPPAPSPAICPGSLQTRGRGHPLSSR